MIAAAAGLGRLDDLYGLVENAAVQIVARMLWGISYASLNLCDAGLCRERPRQRRQAGRRQPRR